jgi:hypothetical protein
MPNSRSETERPTIMSRLETFYRQVPPDLTDDQIMEQIARWILLELSYSSATIGMR